MSQRGPRQSLQTNILVFGMKTWVGAGVGTARIEEVLAGEAVVLGPADATTTRIPGCWDYKGRPTCCTQSRMAVSPSMTLAAIATHMTPAHVHTSFRLDPNIKALHTYFAPLFVTPMNCRILRADENKQFCSSDCNTRIFRTAAPRIAFKFSSFLQQHSPTHPLPHSYRLLADVTYIYICM